MVLEVGAEAPATAVVGAQQAPVGVAQVAQHELRARHGGVAVVVAAQDGARVGQRGDHQRVPRAQALVVEPGAHPPLAGGVQAALDLGELRRVRRRAHGDVRALEVAPRAHAEVLDGGRAELLAERRADLVERPHVVLALDALAVGVQRGGEAALGLAQLAQRPVERLGADPLEQRLAGDLEAVQVRAGEQGVVVEHLLEVRHDPGGVDGVAREAAADLVVDAPGGHRPQRVQRHLALGRRAVGRPRARPAEQELERRGGRELGRAAVEAAALRVVAVLQRAHRAVERLGVELLVGRLQARGARQALDDLRRLLLDLVALVAPGRRDARQDLRPARHPLARLRRVVGAGVERDAVGGDEGVQRPAALAGHRLDGLHVDRVDVRALLAVDLDAHEVLVHERGDPLVLEGLALHHVAPVAGGVADRDDDRDVALARGGERLVAPRAPLDGVVLVLEEVGGGLPRRARWASG